MGRYKKEVGVRSAYDPAGPYLEEVKKSRKEHWKGCSVKAGSEKSTVAASGTEGESNRLEINGTSWPVVDLSSVGGCDFEETLDTILANLDPGGRLAFVALSKEQRTVVHSAAHHWKCQKKSRVDPTRGESAKLLCVEKPLQVGADASASASLNCEQPALATSGYSLTPSLLAAAEAATSVLAAEAPSLPRKCRWRRAAAEIKNEDNIHQHSQSASSSKCEPSVQHHDVISRTSVSTQIRRDVNSVAVEGPICVVWLRDDMRLHDNPALWHASERGYTSVIPVFIDDLANPIPYPLRGAGLYWKHESLKIFSQNLSGLGSKLIVRRGDPLKELLAVFDELLGSRDRTGCVVAFNRRPQQQHCLQDENVAAALKKEGISVESFSANVLYEPWVLQPIEHWQQWRARVRAEDAKARGIEESNPAHSGQPKALEHVSGFGSYRFFHHALEYHGFPDKPCPTVLRLPSCPTSSSLSVDDLGYGKTMGRGFTSASTQCCRTSSSADWAAEMKKWWEVGESAALRRLDMFLDKILSPGDFEGRKRLISDQKNTSELSPYIRFGELSARFVYWKARQRNDKTNQKLWEESEYLREGSGKANATFLRRFVWRDLTYWFLWEFPTMPKTSMRIEYERQVWAGTRKQLLRWKSGNTGFPLVDAAMRQLWAVGWMPNYLRHLVAQTLIEYLDISWKEGLSWFDWTLVDADVAINSFMWQNGGHSGPDHWQFVLHPVNAAKTADPDGSYVRRWLPFLAELPTEFIHRPWDAPLRISRQIDGYPKRIILDLNDARRQHARRVIDVRQQNPHMIASNGHEWLRLPGRKGLLAKLVTRNEFRAETEDFLVEQTPARLGCTQRPSNANMALLEECLKSSS